MARRRDLLVVRAGGSALHERWLLDPARNFDVLAAQSQVDTGYLKLVGDYESIGLARGDLAVDAKWWNTLFHVCGWFGLDLGHPSFRQHSWEALRTQSGCLLRYTTLVDTVAPVFSRRAFDRVRSTFAAGIPEAELPLRWSDLLPWPSYRCGVVDTVPIEGTRQLPAPRVEIREHARLRLVHEEIPQR
jgi:hypothetical protein